MLNKDRPLLKKIAEQGIMKATELFDPIVNTNYIEDLLIKGFYSVNKQKQAIKVYGSRLDHPLLSNSITSLLRNHF